MALIGMRDVCWGFGDSPLLENVTFQVAKGERVCLLGRNGVGKSTLLKLLNCEMLPDSGDVWCRQGATVAVLEQDVLAGFDGTIFDVVAEGLGQKGRALAEHNRICRQLETVNTPELIKRRDELQNRLNSGGGWELLRQVESILSRTRLDTEKKFTDLSAGMKRRTLFARALARQPDILLLDEPTNHLDIDSIIWMEEFILRNVTTLLFITHDRAFLKKIANRIMELDRGRLVSYNCDYETYLGRRCAAFEAEESRNRVFDKKLLKEETWVRQGIKARRTRNEGRVKALKKMREAFRARRKQNGNVRMRVQEAERTGKLVVEAKNISFLRGATPVIRDFATVIMRGDKVGIIGPNGVGKTTLLKILLKKITPHKGRVRHGVHLQVAYSDQLRAQLDTHKTVQENISEANDFIIFNGQKRHVISYLQDFLFSSERCRTPVHVLSGGEKNRLLLAKLFTRPANVLVLDEPTNDLDAETLEFLEKLLFEYQGTLLLVSHDRAFLNNVVTSTLVFEGQGRVNEYAGGYDDWLIQRPQPGQERLPAKKPCNKHGSETMRPKERRLGFKEKLELKELPLKIDSFEAEQKELYAIMSDPMFYKKGKEKIAMVKAHLAEVEDKIEADYLRWETLESIEKGSGADDDHFGTD
ncbi:MAG: ATP-binding cassette domain-containing protein [Thermodesulfobacteriota bacterium]|nr:ATP-binding cassette domain-containing protein [Thermodesulfobacteriota bacterium]